jgi:hypothetical protein
MIDVVNRKPQNVQALRERDADPRLVACMPSSVPSMAGKPTRITSFDLNVEESAVLVVSGNRNKLKPFLICTNPIRYLYRPVAVPSGHFKGRGNPSGLVLLP